MKTVWKLTFFGLKSGQDWRNWAAHPHQEFPGVPPPLLSGTPWLSDILCKHWSSVAESRTFLRARRPQRRRARRSGRFRRLQRKGSTTNIIQHIGFHMPVPWYLAWHFTLIICEPTKTKKKCFENSNNLKNKNMLSPDMGLEPMTLRLKVWCSTDWANRAAHIEI